MTPTRRCWEKFRSPIRQDEDLNKYFLKARASGPSSLTGLSYGQSLLVVAKAVKIYGLQMSVDKPCDQVAPTFLGGVHNGRQFLCIGDRQPCCDHVAFTLASLCHFPSPGPKLLLIPNMNQIRLSGRVFGVSRFLPPRRSFGTTSLSGSFSKPHDRGEVQRRAGVACRIVYLSDVGK